MPRRRSNATTTQVESVRHKDKRANIPTTELRDFVKGDEAQPKAVQFPGLLYARDPSLDPQLVWKGKDEQDQEQLTVPSVPIYIQEKIHPQAIIEDKKEQKTYFLETGEMLGSLRVEQILEEKVTLSDDGEQFDLVL